MILAYLVAPVRAYRESLARTLATDSGIRIVGTAAPHRDLASRITELGADAVLVDMGGRDSLETLRGLAAALPQTKVVAVALSDADRHVIACAEAGAAGFVAADAGIEEIVAATEGAVRGELHCTPRIAAALLGRVAALAAARHAEAVTPLTLRELEIVDLIDEGLSNKEIAQRLSIEVATVKNHVHNILEKLQVKRRTDAVVEARRQGLRRVVLKA